MRRLSLLNIAEFASLCAPLLVVACSSESGGQGGSGPGSGSAGSGSGSTASSAGGGSGSVTSSTGESSSSTSGAGGAGGGAAASCKDLPLCDDFEGAADGSPPDAAKWEITSPNCGPNASKIAVDGAQAHSGSKSLKVTGGGGYCDHIFISNKSAMASVGSVAYGRFFVRLSDALGDGHTTFMTMKDTADNGKDLRMGGQSKILMWNRESDDATLPSLSPAGIAKTVKLAAQAWTCVEFMVDPSTSHLKTWVEGAEVEGLIVDGTPTPDVDQQWLNKAGWKPALADFKLGWESYAGQVMTLWFDDVAIGPQRIGCD